MPKKEVVDAVTMKRALTQSRMKLLKETKDSRHCFSRN